MYIYRVADWMSTPAVSIPPTATLVEAQQLMEERGVRRLPVVQDGRLVGIVSRGDLRAAQPSEATTLSAYEWRALMSPISIADCMQRRLITVGPDEPVLRAAQQMLTYKVSGLPVVDGDRLVGVITESDLFRLLIADLTRSLKPDDPRVSLRCPHCGTILRWRADSAIGHDTRCWNCQRLVSPADLAGAGATTPGPGEG